MQHENKTSKQCSKHIKNIDKNDTGMKLVGEEIASTLEDVALKGAEHEYEPCSKK